MPLFDLFPGADKAPFRREDALCAASIIAHMLLCAIIVDAHSPECEALGTWGAEYYSSVNRLEAALPGSPPQQQPAPER